MREFCKVPITVNINPSIDMGRIIFFGINKG